MSKFVISYARYDQILVTSLAEALRDLDQEVWFDARLVGGIAWWESILQAIRSADVLLFAISKKSLSSRICCLELAYAVALRRTILPVCVASNALREPLPESMGRLHYVDYAKQDKAALIRLARAIKALPLPIGLPDPLPPQPDQPIAGPGVRRLRDAAVALDPPLVATDRLVHLLVLLGAFLFVAVPFAFVPAILVELLFWHSGTPLGPQAAYVFGFGSAAIGWWLAVNLKSGVQGIADPIRSLLSKWRKHRSSTIHRANRWRR